MTRRLIALALVSLVALFVLAAAAPAYEGPPGNEFTATAVEMRYLNPADKIIRFNTNLYRDGQHEPYLISHAVASAGAAWDCFNRYCDVVLDEEVGQPVRRVVNIAPYTGTSVP